jgi:hypothetical protein
MTENRIGDIILCLVLMSLCAYGIYWDLTTYKTWTIITIGCSIAFVIISVFLYGDIQVQRGKIKPDYDGFARDMEQLFEEKERIDILADQIDPFVSGTQTKMLKEIRDALKEKKKEEEKGLEE